MPHNLLLADDSVTIQRVIELTFADEDIQVVAVSDGDQAIARLDAEPPDIVLADIGMPGRDGYQVAEYIKGTPRLAHIPVVLLTGAFEPVDQARAAAVGCDGVLAKPFEPQLVIGRVKELLARPAQAAVVARREPGAAGAAPERHVGLARRGGAFRAAATGRTWRARRLLRSPRRGLRQSVQPAGAAPASSGAADAIDWFDTKPSVPPAAPDRWETSAPPAPAEICRCRSVRRAAPSTGPRSGVRRRFAVADSRSVHSGTAHDSRSPGGRVHVATATAGAARFHRRARTDPSSADAAARRCVRGAPRRRAGGRERAGAGWLARRGWRASCRHRRSGRGGRAPRARAPVGPVVRELASETVAAIAERLVREEIERIKASVE